jgi:hypothetical protein
MNTMHFAIGSVFILAVVVGCGATDVIATPLKPEVPTNWIEHVSAEESFAISLPESWTIFPFDDAEFKSAAEEVIRQDPKLARALGTTFYWRLSRGYDFFAMDTDPASFENNPHGTIVYAGKRRFISRRSLATLLQSYPEAQLESMDGGDILSAEVIYLDGSEAAKIVYKHTPTLETGAKVTVKTLTVLIPHGKDVFEISIMTGEDVFDSVEERFWEIVDTLRVLE